MTRNFLELGWPIAWVIPALLLAVGLTYLLYSKKNTPWSKKQNLILAALRGTGLFLIFLLFLEPLIRHIVNTPEPPIIVFALDNSASIPSIHDEAARKDLLENLASLSDELTNKNDYRVEVMPFFGSKDSIKFDGQITDISGIFRRIEDEFSINRPAAIGLITDGIYNRGVSPTYQNYSLPVFTLGLGDTIPRKDIILRDVRHNAVAFKGNEFPILVKVSQSGFAGRQVEVKIEKSNDLLETQSIVLTPQEQEALFFLSSDEIGLQHYVISVTTLEGEASISNNRYDAYIEVLESKKQIRIAASTPHPDIKAIRKALEKTGNYEITLDIPGIENSKDTPQRFDVQILFDGQKAKNGRSGLWYINTNPMAAHLKELDFIDINVQGRPDQVIPSFNADFTKFSLNKEIGRMKNYPPLSVPFGEYTISGPHEVLLYQQLGSVRTSKPLLAVIDDGDQRVALSMASGIWQWPLQEYARHGDEVLFSELIQKLVQYLSVSDGQKQFKVMRGRDLFTEGDVVYFDVEILNDIMEPMEGQPYTIDITNEQGIDANYDFVFGKDNRIARTNSLPAGKYTYRAKTKIGDKVLQERGEFLISSLQLEQRNLTADHNLLKRISEKSGGAYYHLNEFDAFSDELKNTDYSGSLLTTSEQTPVINLWWILTFIIALFATEWILRKAWGSI